MLPGAGDGGDRPGGIDLPHASVVGHVQVSSSVEGDTARIPKLGGGGRASVAGMPIFARAGEGGDDAPFVHLANTKVVLVCDVDVSLRVERNVAGPAETSRGCGTAVSELLPTVARHSLYGGGLLCCSVLSTAATAGACGQDD